jgi:hypothetical protein
MILVSFCQIAHAAYRRRICKGQSASNRILRQIATEYAWDYKPHQDARNQPARSHHGGNVQSRPSWDVHPPEKTIAIDLYDEAYNELVVEVDNPESTFGLYQNAF